MQYRWCIQCSDSCSIKMRSETNNICTYNVDTAKSAYKSKGLVNWNSVTLSYVNWTSLTNSQIGKNDATTLILDWFACWLVLIAGTVFFEFMIGTEVLDLVWFVVTSFLEVEFAASNIKGDTTVEVPTNGLCYVSEDCDFLLSLNYWLGA